MAIQLRFLFLSLLTLLMTRIFRLTSIAYTFGVLLLMISIFLDPIEEQ